MATKKILIIDKEDEHKSKLKTILSDSIYVIESASSSMEGLKIVEQGGVDLILLNLIMPEIDGYEMCQRIMQDPENKNILIILYCSKFASIDKIKAFDTGAVDYMTYPFDASEVMLRIEVRLLIQELREILEVQNQQLLAKNLAIEGINIKLSQEKISIENANRIKTNFLANISHELRTPLHIIKGFANMILKKSTALIQDLANIKDPDKLLFLAETLHLDQKDWETHTHYWLQRIIENQERQLKLVNNLLDLAKMESGMTKLSLSDGNLFEVVSACLAELEPLFNEKKIQFKLVDNLLQKNFKFSEEQVCGLIKNLLSNALKFTSKYGKIIIYFESDVVDNNDMIVLKIQDTGPGIPDGELLSIFEPFSQSSMTKGVYEGSGLGLSICHDIVMAHGGRIEANNHPDGGAIFTVWLPRKAF